MRNLYLSTWLCAALIACGAEITDAEAEKNSDSIRNGVDASPGAYPFYVQLVLKGVDELIPICGGALIDPQHVLTVAHCLDNFRRHDGTYDPAHVRSSLFAILGVTSRNQALNPQPYYPDVKAFEVEKVYVPDTYRHVSDGEQMYHDMALLRLVDQQHWFNRVLWGPKDPAAPMTYVGLGRQADSRMEQLQENFLDWVIGDYQLLSEYPFYLQQAETQLVTGSDCDDARTMVDTNELDASKFCIDVGTVSPDYGDSGGPVIQIDAATGAPRLVGLLQGMKGVQTLMRRYPSIGLVTEVEAYRNWINWTLHESYQTE